MHVKRQVIGAAGVLAARTGAFPAAEGLEAGPRAGGGALRTIGVRDARLDVVEEPVHFLVRAIKTGGQAIVDAVGNLHGFGQILDLANRSDGQEHLLLPERVRERHIHRQGWLAEIALRQVAVEGLAASQEAPGLREFLAEILEIVISRLVDDRPQEGLALGRVADDQFFGQVFQPGGQFIVDRLLDQDAAGRRAFLALQAKRRADDAGGGLLQVGAARNDGRVFAAQLEDDGPDVVAAGEILEQFHADIERTGKGDAVYFGAVDQRLAEGASRPGNEVDHPIGESGVAEAIDQQARNPGRIGGGLDNDRVAGHEGRARRAASEGKREVERADDEPDAVGAQHGNVGRIVVGQRVFAEGLDVAVVGFHLVAGVINQVGGLLHVANGLHPVFAHFQRHSGAQAKQPFFDESGRFAQQGDPLLPGSAAPHREGLARSGQCLAGVLRVAFLHQGQHHVGIDRGTVLELFIRKNIPAIDEHGILPAQTGFLPGQRQVIAVMQFFGRVEHGGIGKFEIGHPGFSFGMVELL